ncbi:MAG: amidohydrolase [Acidobacteria bacterium]|nr:MAG: amidohydrolase [Acidobacteriota bacterium]
MYAMNRRAESILAAAAVLICLGRAIASAQPASTAPVDLVLVNGNVLTVDPEFSIAQAVAVSDGRFVRVGRNEEVLSLVGQQTRVVDLKGQTLVPGFIDTHPHTFGRAGRSLRSPSLVGLRSVSAIAEAVAQEVSRTPPGQWIVTTPIGEPPDYFHLPESLEEKRWPTRADLDAVAPENPVYIPIGIWPYPVIFNGVALKRIGITASEPPDGNGVRIERDPSSGEPTGLVEGMTFYNRSPLWEKLQAMLPRPSPEMRREALRQAVYENAAAGVTTIFESHAAQPAHLEHYRALRASGDLPGRVVMSYSVNNLQSVDEIDKWMSELPQASGRGSGDDVIKTLGVTIALDGATQFGAAHMNEPYLDVYGEPTTGSMPMGQEKLSAIALLAARHNLRLQFTFAGDAAAEMILLAIEEAEANEHTSIVDRRWLMQHFQHPTKDHVLRTQQLGLHVTGYTAVDYSKGAVVYVDRFGGDDRWKSVIPTRWWFDAGVNIAQSTDGAHYEAPFTLWESLVRIDGRTGESLMSPAKQISREEALRMYTLNGARVLFWEDQLGSIEPGKLADLVVLDRDILTCPVDEIKDAKVMLTIVGGEVVYEASP